MGFFCCVDGPNGAGKTTLINNLSRFGYTTLSSPNGTKLAKLLRPMCRGTDGWGDIDRRIQFMLFSAARLDEYIRLVHGKDDICVADRWWTSTYVYQCKFEGIDEDFLKHTIHPEEKIDLVLHLDADDNVLIERAIGERERNVVHGHCKWTQDSSNIITLANYYRYDLMEYLDKIGVRHETINTTDKSIDEVTEDTVRLIERMAIRE
jgi:thymidylate kinase